MSRVRHSPEMDRLCLKAHTQEHPCVREPDSEVICDSQDADTVSVMTPRNRFESQPATPSVTPRLAGGVAASISRHHLE